MLVELKSGETLNGLLVACDTWMNLTLKEVIQTSSTGDKFMRLPEIYVRGSTVCVLYALIKRISMLIYGRSSTSKSQTKSSTLSRSSRLRTTKRAEADEEEAREVIIEETGEVEGCVVVDEVAAVEEVVVAEIARELLEHLEMWHCSLAKVIVDSPRPFHIKPVMS